eukprot:7536187-Alexandrium_andersonii.AAC.1
MAPTPSKATMPRALATINMTTPVLTEMSRDLPDEHIVTTCAKMWRHGTLAVTYANRWNTERGGMVRCGMA